MVCSDACQWSNFGKCENDENLSNDNNVDGELVLIENVFGLSINQR